jgi:hypothetical protein
LTFHKRGYVKHNITGVVLNPHGQPVVVRDNESCQNSEHIKPKKDFEMRRDCVGDLLVRVRYYLKIVEKALTLSAVRGMIEVE